MQTLPRWWNDLLDWFLATKPAALPPNMCHAWYVNRYADEVCNGGFCDFIAQKKAKQPNDKLLESVSLVGGNDHAAVLLDALDFARNRPRKPRVPKIAFLAQTIAYDGIQRGWAKEQALQSVAQIYPEVPKAMYEAIFSAASHEFEMLERWESLNRRFYDLEPSLRLRIAEFAARHKDEWLSLRRAQ